MKYEDACKVFAMERIKAGRFFVGCRCYLLVEDKYELEVWYHSMYMYKFTFDTAFERELLLDQLEKIGGYTDRDKFDRENSEYTGDEVNKIMREQ